MALTVLLAGGGTGGHVFPALALADAIRKLEPTARVGFVGSERGIERRVVPAAGYPLHFVRARPFMGQGAFGALRALAVIALGTLDALRLLRAERADLVIGLGGWASVPTVAAAAALRIPIGLMQPDAQPGRANRLLGRFARGVFTQFDESAAAFPGRAHRTGLPVREIPAWNGPSSDGVTRLLVFGGSQGAHSINRALGEGAARLGEPRAWRITHQTGPTDLEAIRAAYREAGFEAEVEPFFDDLPERIARADLIVARGGISTLSELCAAGAPAVLVPYPFAADDHQMQNARALERDGGCVALVDAEVETRLIDTIRELAADPDRRRAMGAAAARRASPDAAARIWSICVSWLRPATEEGR